MAMNGRNTINVFENHPGKQDSAKDILFRLRFGEGCLATSSNKSHRTRDFNWQICTSAFPETRQVSEFYALTKRTVGSLHNPFIRNSTKAAPKRISKGCKNYLTTRCIARSHPSNLNRPTESSLQSDRSSSGASDEGFYPSG
ncbi:hypothetical protein CDAR_560981 [Caerostris darwini]|uniref:Uncharacterized protein n=1 Tax=Caerostris darwini TaxID=1538125 RepID=A0AAV4TBX2_9ARAC|nr:hypothetical protein CDAR_560981 [Caerostris darwini]